MWIVQAAYGPLQTTTRPERGRAPSRPATHGAREETSVKLRAHHFVMRGPGAHQAQILTDLREGKIPVREDCHVSITQFIVIIS